LIPYPNGQPVLIDGSNKGGYIAIPGSAQNGGSCAMCSQTSIVPQSGGNFFKPINSIPGPFVGSAWGGSLNKWPGMNGIGGDRHFLKNYDADNNIVSQNPQLQMSMGDSGYNTLKSITGGNKKKSSRKSMKAGGIVPQDLVNLGSDFSFNLKSAYNALNGYKAPVDPLPYKDQLSHSLNNSKLIL
jgi:hypothetical protein